MAGIEDIAGLAMGANPYAGVAEIGTSAIKGITEAITASQQAKRAKELRDQANKVQTEQMRPEFKTALQNAQMQSTYGLPALQTYRDQINQNMANNIRAIKESSPNGAATLAAISANLNNSNQAQKELSAKDAAAQEGKSTAANNTLWKVGEQGRYLEDIRDKQKAAIQQQAAALENAATANKQTGINDAVGGIEQGASQLFKKGYKNPYGATQVADMGTGAGGGSQLPSDGGGLTPDLNYMTPSYTKTSQDYTAGSYVPITSTPSNYNWSIYQ